jgi:hypothetical protein
LSKDEYNLIINGLVSGDDGARFVCDMEDLESGSSKTLQSYKLKIAIATNAPSTTTAADAESVGTDEASKTIDNVDNVKIEREREEEEESNKRVLEGDGNGASKSTLSITLVALFVAKSIYNL